MRRHKAPASGRSDQLVSAGKMDSSDMDTHLCLVCQEHIVGLMNYVMHKQSGCQKKPSAPQPETGSFKFDSDSQLYSNNSGQQQNGPLSDFHRTSNYSLSNHDSFLSSFQHDGHFSGHQPAHSSSDHAYTASQPSTGQSSSGLDVDVTSPLSSFIDSAFSPGGNSPVDLQGAGPSKSNPDFFHSLELERKGTEKSGGETTGRTLRNKRKVIPEEFDMDLPITMILSNLDFSSDEETGVGTFSAEDFDFDGPDPDWIDTAPPQSHTGGKWKEGEGPNKPYHPHHPTGGKWKPGQRPFIRSKYTFSKSGKSFYCNLCKATYLDKLNYTSHLMSSEHKEAEEAERTGRTIKKKSEEPQPLVPTPVLDSTTGEMVEMLLPQNYHKEQEEEPAIIKRSQNNLCFCQTCNLYFDTVKVYEIHCETKMHKDMAARKTDTVQDMTLSSGETAQAAESSQETESKDVLQTVTVSEAETKHVIVKKEREEDKSEKSQPEVHECIICKKKFARKYEMARHLLTQFHRQRAMKHPKKLEMFSKYEKYVIRLCPYQCTVCQFYFNRSSDLLDHLQSDNHEENCRDLVGPLLCVTCKFKTALPDQLLEHVQSQPHKVSVAKNHHVCIIRESHSRITCKYCGVQMHSAVRMKRHIAFRHKDRHTAEITVEDHPNEKSHKCPECPKEFRFHSDMRKHFNHRHMPKGKCFECKICNKSFCLPRTLDSHKQSSYHAKRVREHELALEYLAKADLMKNKEDTATEEKEPGSGKEAAAKGASKETTGEEVKIRVGKKRGRKPKAEKQAEALRLSASARRSRRSIQKPRRYYEGSGSDNYDADTDVETDIDADVSKAVERVLEMEKNAESGDPSDLAQNSLPEIHGVDVGAVEITDNEEEHSDTDDEMQEEDENDDGANRKRKVARKSKNDIDKDDPDFLLKKKERIDEVKKLKIFPCYLCKYNAGDIEEMHKHALEEHPKEIIKCEPCSQIFYIRKHYKVHCAGSVHQKNLLRSNVKLEVLTCRFCQKKFMDESSHDLHVEYIHMHNSSEEQISRLCQGRDLVTQLYGDHLKQLAKAPFNARVSCPECGRFCAKNGLIEHLRTHTGERPFKCRHCNKTFISTLALRRHILDHIGVPIMKCQECGKTFKKNHLYHRHILIHENMKNGVKYSCDKCDSSFYHIDGLKAHAKRHRERQFKCPVQGCKWSFVGKPDLTEHMYTHTREKKYLCDICGYEGGTRTRIRRHYKTHEPGKMFTCEYCPYKGASKSHLQRHVRIHTGSKPYKCLYCSYECNVGVNMRKHILQTRKHQGMHLYPCRFCDYKSNVADEFKQHLVQLHSDYYRRRASVPLMLFTGLYRPEKDIQKPPEGSEIHQVMKGRFVKIYDGTRVGALEAAGPVKKKSKPPRTMTQNSVDDPSASHSQPQQQHSSGLHSTSILHSHVTGGLQSHQPPLNGLQSRETPKSEDEMDKPDISLPCTSSEVTSVSVSQQQQQQLQTSASAGPLDMVYPRGLPWTVVTPSSRAESWMPGAQMVDMVMPQPCRIQDLQVVGGNQTSVPTPFISNSGINFLTTINMEGATYTPLEAGVYQVITPATSDAIASVNVVHQ